MIMANRNQQPMSKIVTMRVQVFAKGAKFSMFKPAEEMVYIGLDEESRTKGKAAIDVVGAQSGKSAGSVLQQVTPLSSLHMLQTPTVCQFAKCKSQLGMITTAGSSSSFSTELQTFSRLRQQYLALPCIQKYHHLTNMQVMTVISNALQGANMHCADNIHVLYSSSWLSAEVQAWAGCRSWLWLSFSCYAVGWNLSGSWLHFQIAL